MLLVMFNLPNGLSSKHWTGDYKLQPPSISTGITFFERLPRSRNFLKYPNKFHRFFCDVFEFKKLVQVLREVFLAVSDCYFLPPISGQETRLAH